MAERLQSWRSGSGERLWLSMLVDTMEEISRPEIRMLRCDPSALAGARAQLALSAPALPYYAEPRLPGAHRAISSRLPN
jgi:hypothetical protein